MSSFTFQGEELMLIQCGTCGVKHAIQKSRYDICVEEGGFWHCPNGHSRGFHQGRHENERVQRERDRLKQENARLVEEAAAATRAKERAKADLRRYQKRSAAGTCPCCQRTFVNMAMHMRKQHPEFVADNVVKLNAG